MSHGPRLPNKPPVPAAGGVESREPNAGLPVTKGSLPFLAPPLLTIQYNTLYYWNNTTPKGGET